MKIIPRLIAITACLFSCYVHSDQTHCNEKEEVFFNCKIKSSEKVLSVCGNTRYENSLQIIELQYRYGKPNQIELLFPQTMNESAEKFKYWENYSRGNGHWMGELSFVISKNKYKVFLFQTTTRNKEKGPEDTVLGPDGEGGLFLRSSGVEILTSSHKEITLLCDDSSLKSGLSMLNNLVPEGE